MVATIQEHLPESVSGELLLSVLFFISAYCSVCQSGLHPCWKLVLATGFPGLTSTLVILWPTWIHFKRFAREYNLTVELRLCIKYSQFASFCGDIFACVLSVLMRTSGFYKLVIQLFFLSFFTFFLGIILFPGVGNSVISWILFLLWPFSFCLDRASPFGNHTMESNF